MTKDERDTQALDPDVREAKILSGDVSTRYSIYLRYAPRYPVVAPRDVVIDVRRESNGCTWFGDRRANGAALRHREDAVIARLVARRDARAIASAGDLPDRP